MPAAGRATRAAAGRAEAELHPYVLIPLLSTVAAAILATAILARDARHTAHRLAAAILGCAAYWSFLEVIWNSLDSAAWVPLLVRLSSLGWMPLGVFCVHLFLELGADRRSRLRGFLPALYGFVLVSALLYIATPWGIAGAVRTSWGWSFTMGPLFVFQYTPTASLASLSLAVLWRRVCPRDAPASERRQGRWVLAGIAVPLVVASSTDAILPFLGVHVPRLGAASMTFVGAAVAWCTWRYGYSVLAPGTFAPQILATLRDGVVLLRRDGLIRSANASFGRVCGLPPERLVGRPVAAFLPDVGPDEDEIVERECELRAATGESIAVSVSASALRDRDGERVGRVLSVRDVREVVSLRNRLVMSGRLAAVGELAAGIAHEINNPIAFVQANLNQLAQHWRLVGKRLRDAHGDESMNRVLTEGRELVDESLVGALRVASIVRDVGGFAGAGHDREAVADLNALLEMTLRIAEPQLRYRASIGRSYGVVPGVRCDPQELKQVFLDLLLNASDAVEEGGSVRVSTRAAGAWAVVEIEDDGCGMPPEILERIFDPFFTTKAAGEGTGLGLSLAFEIVRRHGGDLEVASAPGRGTTFRIRLPAESGGAPSEAPESAQPAPEGA
jgi:PAS domain S-box-containing protein